MLTLADVRVLRLIRSVRDLFSNETARHYSVRVKDVEAALEGVLDQTSPVGFVSSVLEDAARVRSTPTRELAVAAYMTHTGCTREDATSWVERHVASDGSVRAPTALLRRPMSSLRSARAQR